MENIKVWLFEKRSFGYHVHVMNYVIICNPIAGCETGRAHADELVDRFRRHDIEPDVFYTEKPGDARCIAGEFGSETRLLCVGGDGTLNEVVNGLNLSAPPRVLICPVGTGNVMAGELRVPFTPEKQVRLARSDRYRWFDVGRCDDGRFVSMAGIGFDAEVVHAFHRNRGPSMNFVRYAMIGTRTLLNLRKRTVGIHVDGRHRTDEATFVQIANTRSYGGPFVFSPGASPDDGRFDVHWLENGATFDLSRLCLSALFGLPFLNPDYRSATGQTVRVESHAETPPRLQLDGDPASFKTGRFSIIPRAIPLFTPAGTRSS